LLVRLGESYGRALPNRVFDATKATEVTKRAAVNADDVAVGFVGASDPLAEATNALQMKRPQPAACLPANGAAL